MSRWLIKITTQTSEMGKKPPKAYRQEGSHSVQCRVSYNLRHDNGDFAKTREQEEH